MGSTKEFRETFAKFMCLPSSACQSWLGEPLDQHGLHLDACGDNIISVSNITGDMFRVRHDMVKTALNSFCLTADKRAEVEVYGLFKGYYTCTTGSGARAEAAEGERKTRAASRLQD